jgi:hypothetical protein
MKEVIEREEKDQSGNMPKNSPFFKSEYLDEPSMQTKRHMKMKNEGQDSP